MRFDPTFGEEGAEYGLLPYAASGRPDPRQTTRRGAVWNDPAPDLNWMGQPP